MNGALVTLNDGVWWLMVIHDGSWWLYNGGEWWWMVISQCWSMMMNGGFWWSMMVNVDQGDWWPSTMVNYDGLWFVLWWTMVNENQFRLMLVVIYDNNGWGMMINGDESISINAGQWWWMMIYDDTWWWMTMNGD